MSAHKPATPLLPFKVEYGVNIMAADGKQWDDRPITGAAEIAAYLCHAANAYPNLVARLAGLIAAEEEYGDQSNAAINQAWGPAVALLRELGELP